MLTVLMVLPWALTVAALVTILFLRNKDVEAPKMEDDFIVDSEDKEIVRILVYRDKAYWVYNNVFYESEIIPEPDFTTAKPIDTMELSSKELNELMAILDELQEQENERD